MFVSRFCTAVIMLITLAPVMAYSGDLDSPAAPTGTSSAMYTLTDIYNRLDIGTVTAKRAGAFTEPTDGTGTATGYTLNEIMAIAPEKDGDNGATALQVLSGKTFWGLTTAGWGTQTGSIVTQTLSDASTTVSAGYYNATTLSAVDADLVTGNIKSSVTIFGVAGKTEVVDTTSGGDAVAGDILSGKIAYVGGGTVTGNIVTRTLGSGTTNVDAGYYAATDLATVDTDLVAANIGTGTTIFGVTGTLTPLATCSGTLNGTRWCDNGNGTVTDLTTGLVWLKKADWGGAVAFWVNTSSATNAHDRAAVLKAGAAGAELSDGSAEGDWRLPTLKELKALTIGTEPVSSGNMRAFSGVQSYYYWSGTTYSLSTSRAWHVNLYDGYVLYGDKPNTYYVWPVRAGQ